ncbi:MAG TPA: fumarylacetoacetate hydrolase family protein [Alphaproteobacteria bacterium]|nr:fumarylacetoacetate hydrolase family protein [Alphaproteobacteria bacterium]
MKLATFSLSGRTSWGVVAGDEIADVGKLLGGRFPSLKEVIAGQAFSSIIDATESASRIPTADIEWLPVIPDPAKILCIGLNYETHRRETGREATGHPAVFTRFADTQLGHRASIVRPHVSTALDYEGELAVVIGRGGRYIKRQDAMAHVAGYACYNDATVRDWQRHTIQFTPGKNFPGTGALGPVVVTADEIGDYTKLHIETRVNGVTVQSAELDQLIFDIPTLIEYCSAFTPLAPGDLIATGTPGGVGFKREPPLFLKPGDTVEVEIPRVGTLVNGVTDER